jgi:hypothetical protein
MDLRQYYSKIRQTEAMLKDECVLVVSEETPDGGRAGVVNEVARVLAAKMIVEGRARLATSEEKHEYEQHATQVRRLAEQAAAAKRIQVAVLSESEIRALRRKE